MREVRPGLKALVAEASQALARLDTARLEELALSCAALNRDISPLKPADKEALAREAREAVGEMAVFARVLEATRGNLRVMNRLRELRMGRLEYSERQAAGGGWSQSGIPAGTSAPTLVKMPARLACGGEEGGDGDN